MDAKFVAQSIWNQIMHFAPNSWAVMAWGISSKVYGYTEDKEKNPYLMMRVSGNKFKGYVKIVYRQCPDLYWLHFITSKGVEKKAYERIGDDQLFDLIDNEVEKSWRK